MNIKKIITVIVAMIMLLCLGLIYGWSIFVAPLEAEFGWSRAQTSLTFTISMAMFCIAGLIAGVLSRKKVKPFLQMVSAGIILLIGFVLASYSTELIHFYLAYGVLCGAGVGFTYNILISAVSKLFPDKQGFISGILMMSFGFGGLVLGSICSMLITTVGWREMFKVIGIAIGLIVIVSSVILKITLAQESNESATIQTKEKQANPEKNSNDMTTKEMVKDGTFKILYLWLVVLSSAGLLIIGHIGPLAGELGASATVIVWAVGMVSIFNGLGRVLCGISYDKMGAPKTLWTISACLVIASILLTVAVNMGSLPLLLVGSAALGISYGGSPTSTSALANRLYGSKNFSSNFSILVTNLLPAAIIGPNLASFLQGGSGSYHTTLYALIVLAIIGVVLCLAITKSMEKKKSHEYI
ncbi:MAG: OFA family MFS transporter [Anaerovoracaceae bacterium]|jgi:OFA family oxalate/formate antiporter-like MFS transporter